MRRYVLKRILLGIIAVIGVSIIVFILARLSGDVALLLAPNTATEEDIQNIRAQYGLDKSVVEQYGIFAVNAVRGDLGKSIQYNLPVTELIAQKIPATLELAGLAFLVSICTGVFIGVISATRRDSLIDWLGRIFAMLGQSMPGFWVGIMLILVFGVMLKWLPTSGRGEFSQLIMPAFALGWFSMASIMRITRSAMLDVMDSEYIKLARIKGNPERIVIWKHALKNAMIPVIGVAGLQLTFAIGGAVIIESVFRWPGMGSLIIQAVVTRDYPVIQGGVLVLSMVFIAVNLIVDVMAGVIDPRVRFD